MLHMQVKNFLRKELEMITPSQTNAYGVVNSSLKSYTWIVSFSCFAMLCTHTILCVWKQTCYFLKNVLQICICNTTTVGLAK